MPNPFKVGDRVRVYDNSVFTRVITRVDGDYVYYNLDLRTGLLMEYKSHYKACRKLVKKKKRRSIFIPNRVINNPQTDGYNNEYISYSPYLNKLPKREEAYESFTKFVEVKKKRS